MKNKKANIYFKMVSIIILILYIYFIPHYSYAVNYKTWDDMYNEDEENWVKADMQKEDNYAGYTDILMSVNYDELEKEEKKSYEMYVNVLIKAMKGTDASGYETFISYLEKKIGKNSNSGSDSNTEQNTNESYKKLYDSLNGIGNPQAPPDTCSKNEWDRYMKNFENTNATDVDKKYTTKYIEQLTKLANNTLLSKVENETALERIKNEVQEAYQLKGITTQEQYKNISKIATKLGKHQDEINDRKEDIAKAKASKTTIYKSPDKTTSGNTSEQSLDDMVSDADTFTKKGTLKYNPDTLQNFSKTFYNIMLTIGIFVAVIIGGILGIKFMVSGLEEKAEVKKMLLIYLIGCIVIFGGFAIWKLVVDIMQNVWG